VKSAARRIALGVGSFVVLVLALDGLVAACQPALESGDREVVLRTQDSEGGWHESRMIVVEDGDTLWVQSGHHFRGWYWRLVADPRVELVRSGVTKPYYAAALETPEAKAHMRALLKQRVGVVGYYAIRTFLLFADVKPVRLDPIESSGRG
jgi:hypothetical protein